MANDPQTDFTPPPPPGASYGNPRDVRDINVTVSAPPSNGAGTAGFVLALLGLLLCWVPLVGWLLWLLGLIFSAIGLKRQPKGLATAGMVISLVALVALVAMIGCAAAVASAVSTATSTM